jgi:soluble lytic murein transglycosylase-like protein
LNQRAIFWLLFAAAGVVGFAGIFHRVNTEATAKYAAITGRADYRTALQKSVEIVPREIVAAAPKAALVQPPAPRPIKIYPDTPPLSLARSYVESNPSRYTLHIRSASRATNVPAALIRAVITAESAFNPYALSATGAVGLMQLMPETAARYGVTNRMDPSQNILGGARYLSDLMRLFHNNMHLAVAAYNAGEGSVLKYGRKIPPFPETVAYVPRVLAYYKNYKKYHLA